MFAAVLETPIAFIVFRCILGLSPAEWAYITTERTGVAVDQGFARLIDRNFRMNPLSPASESIGVTAARIRAMIDAGVSAILQGTGTVAPGIVHRLDKADTAKGQLSLQSIADLGAPYPVLLYERFLGRPFATHRDSVSELVGEVVEVAVKNVLSDAKISIRETKRAERIPGFDQASSFPTSSRRSP